MKKDNKIEDIIYDSGLFLIALGLFLMLLGMILRECV